MKVWRVFLAVTLLLIAGRAPAQWTSQEIVLNPGWNAVFVEVSPVPNHLDDIFDGVPVESVWKWDKKLFTVEFVVDPEELLPTQPDWLVYFPPSSPQAAAKTLYTFQGGSTYLIKLLGTRQVTLNLVGKTFAQQRIDWIGNSFNLVGFRMMPGSAQYPTFRQFFAMSPVHARQKVMRMNPDGRWGEADAETAELRPGEAFWIYTVGQSQFRGALDVSVVGSGELSFGRTLSEDTITIRNNSPEPREIRLRSLPSLPTPPNPDPELDDEPLVAGPVPLQYYSSLSDGRDQPAYLNVPGPGEDPIVFTLASGASRDVLVGVNRLEMNNFSPPPGKTSLYQSFLEVTDDLGSFALVPVNAQSLTESFTGVGTTASGRALRRQEDPPVINPRAGLWVGQVSVDAVSQPADPVLADTPVLASSDFNFRIIVHVDEGGVARLLQHVLLMFKPAETDENGVVVVPGEVVLLTDDALISNYVGQVRFNNQRVARRISSAVFGTLVAESGEPRNTLRFAGTGFDNLEAGDNPTGVLEATVFLSYKDTLNPYYHRFHPDHDNLNFEFQPFVNDPNTTRDDREGIESWDVIRDIELEFRLENPQPGLGSPLAWRDSRVGGIYRETITGVHRDPIHVSGNFVLQRVSNVPRLNDQEY